MQRIVGLGRSLLVYILVTVWIMNHAIARQESVPMVAMWTDAMVSGIRETGVVQHVK